MKGRSHSLIALFLAIVVSGLLGVACGGNQGNKNTTLDTPSPSPSPNLCGSITDGMLVDMIYAKLIKDPDIFPKIKQINIYASAGAVTIMGWADDAAKFAKVIDTAKTISPCVKSVDSTKFYDHAPGPPLQWNPNLPGNGCGPGLVRCGDVCVPDRCFWSNDAPSPMPTSTGSTPGNTNTKSNSNMKY